MFCAKALFNTINLHIGNPHGYADIKFFTSYIYRLTTPNKGHFPLFLFFLFLKTTKVMKLLKTVCQRESIVDLIAIRKLLS